ncbi:AraC family transcriptional regulator [Nitrospirillum pindoramense]|uniref:AraC family transcriptional activator of mtrCDE n=1 Tax=Nitrospirillum amazonense TaxID=28077 RepID=A0A560GNW7_9PROT|nr:AraC family transcriptional regulator [Nitrospirillum amazonense]TWB35264.1 AraC family transcriptional activator of mtrCDE [Nitrospirillum amazonense]
MDDGRNDVLSTLAPLIQVRPLVEQHCLFGPGWSAPHAREPLGMAPFHIVTAGSAQVLLPDLERILHLAAGDVLLLPHGTRHTVRTAGTVAAPTTRLNHRDNGVVEVKWTSDLPEAVSAVPSDGSATPLALELICGRFAFERVADNPLLALLPEAVHLKAADQRESRRLARLVETIRDEVALPRPGGRAIATDLARALFTMILRGHLEGHGAGTEAAGLLARPATARVVAALVRDPARAWTLDELADQAHLSRATLVRAFRAAGAPAPLAFLAQVRMTLAVRHLVAEGLSLAETAARVGYESESAFSRAFKRHYHAAPGDYRDAARA